MTGVYVREKGGGGRGEREEEKEGEKKRNEYSVEMLHDNPA